MAEKEVDFNKPASAFTKPIRTFMCSILLIFGLWRPLEKSKQFQNIYSFYSFILITIFSLMYTVSMVTNIFLLKDMSSLSNSLFMTLTQVALAIKIVNFFFNNREWQQIFTDLDDFPIKSEADVNILGGSVRIFQIAM